MTKICLHKLQRNHIQTFNGLFEISTHTHTPPPFCLSRPVCCFVPLGDFHCALCAKWMNYPPPPATPCSPTAPTLPLSPVGETARHKANEVHLLTKRGGLPDTLIKCALQTEVSETEGSWLQLWGEVAASINQHLQKIYSKSGRVRHFTSKAVFNAPNSAPQLRSFFYSKHCDCFELMNSWILAVFSTFIQMNSFGLHWTVHTLPQPPQSTDNSLHAPTLPLWTTIIWPSLTNCQTWSCKVSTLILYGTNTPQIIWELLRIKCVCVEDRVAVRLR